MIELSITAILLCFILLPLAVIVGIILISVRIFAGPLGGEAKARYERESRLIQELYRTMGRYEERIDNLETILMDHGLGHHLNPETETETSEDDDWDWTRNRGANQGADQ